MKPPLVLVAELDQVASDGEVDAITIADRRALVAQHLRGREGSLANELLTRSARDLLPMAEQGDIVALSALARVARSAGWVEGGLPDAERERAVALATRHIGALPDDPIARAQVAALADGLAGSFAGTDRAALLRSGAWRAVPTDEDFAKKYVSEMVEQGAGDELALVADSIINEHPDGLYARHMVALAFEHLQRPADADEVLAAVPVEGGFDPWANHMRVHRELSPPTDPRTWREPRPDDGLGTIVQPDEAAAVHALLGADVVDDPADRADELPPALLHAEALEVLAELDGSYDAGRVVGTDANDVPSAEPALGEDRGLEERGPDDGFGEL